MKIAIYWIQKDSGGVDTQLINMLKYWPDQSDQFIIFTNQDNLGFLSIRSDIDELKNVSVIKVRSEYLVKNKIVKLVKFIFFPLYFMRLYHIVKNEIKKYSFDALLVQNGGYPGSWKALAALWSSYSIKLKKRVLLIHHGAVHGNIIRRPGESMVDYMVQQWATDIVTVSHATRKTLIDNRGMDPYINPIRVIHNGFEINIEDENAIDNKLTLNLREYYGIPSNVNLIGIIGRIERYKGHEDLLIALSELPENIQINYAVVIIGTETEDGEINRLNALAFNLNLKSKIVFTGYIDCNISEIMPQLDLLTMMTKDFEGFGLTIGEAMVSNVPVICTDVGAVTEFVNSNVATIIPPESPSDLTVVIREHFYSKDRFIEKANLAKGHIKKFHVEIMARKYFRLIRLE